MMPFREINIHDIYVSGGRYNNMGLEYHVVDKNNQEKMVLIQAWSTCQNKAFREPFWKSNKDRLFSLSNRVFTLKISGGVNEKS